MASNCEYCGDELTCAQCEPNEYVEHVHKTLEALQRKVNSGVCTLAGPGRGDCEHAVGLPGKSVPGQHDGDDDTVDVYGKPNGWCWSCWKSHQIKRLEAEVMEFKDWQKKDGEFYRNEIRRLEKDLEQAKRSNGMNWKR